MLSEHPIVWAVISFLLISFPQWLSGVWALHSSEPFFVWLRRQPWSGVVFARIVKWAPVSIGLGLLILIAWQTYMPARTVTPSPTLTDLGQARADQKRALELNLMLVETMPKYYWKLTGRGTRPIPLDGGTLIEKYVEGGEVWFTPMIYNGNDGVPLTDADMTVWLPSALQHQPLTMWRPLDPTPDRNVWWGVLVRAVPGRGIEGINEAFHLKLSRPDVYPVSWRVRGTALGISLERSGEFLMRIVAPGASKLCRWLGLTARR